MADDFFPGTASHARTLARLKSSFTHPYLIVRDRFEYKNALHEVSTICQSKTQPIPAYFLGEALFDESGQATYCSQGEVTKLDGFDIFKLTETALNHILNGFKATSNSSNSMLLVIGEGTGFDGIDDPLFRRAGEEKSGGISDVYTLLVKGTHFDREENELGGAGYTMLHPQLLSRFLRQLSVCRASSNGLEKWQDYEHDVTGLIQKFGEYVDSVVKSFPPSTTEDISPQLRKTGTVLYGQMLGSINALRARHPESMDVDDAAELVDQCLPILARVGFMISWRSLTADENLYPMYVGGTGATLIITDDGVFRSGSLGNLSQFPSFNGHKNVGFPSYENLRTVEHQTPLTDLNLSVLESKLKASCVK